MISKPEPNEYHPFYGTYIQKMPDKDVVEVLREQLSSFPSFLAAISEEKATTAYAADKWTIKEVVNHINDVERIFTYRALCIARGEKGALPGMDENGYQAAAGDASGRSLASLAEEFVALRTATIFLFQYLPDSAAEAMGTADGNTVSVRALAAMTYGHCEHHHQILKERYL